MWTGAFACPAKRSEARLCTQSLMWNGHSCPRPKASVRRIKVRIACHLRGIEGKAMPSSGMRPRAGSDRIVLSAARHKCSAQFVSASFRNPILVRCASNRVGERDIP